jgi:hypothetical protein
VSVYDWQTTGDFATLGQVDDRWIMDWIRYGLDEINHYLDAQARFEAWCRENDR